MNGKYRYISITGPAVSIRSILYYIDTFHRYLEPAPKFSSEIFRLCSPDVGLVRNFAYLVEPYTCTLHPKFLISFGVFKLHKKHEIIPRSQISGSFFHWIDFTIPPTKVTAFIVFPKGLWRKAYQISNLYVILGADNKSAINSPEV